MNDEILLQGKSSIETRALGHTEVRITPIGFGCASVWGKNLISDAHAFDLFERAYELGIRYFDTGHSYGIAEERIGKILKSSNTLKRDEIVISTKFGTRYIDGKAVHDVSTDWIKRSLEISLTRMNIDYVDCLQLHGPSMFDFTDELFYLLQDFKSQGLVKAVGANSFDTCVLECIRDNKYFDFVMLDYNVMRQDREPLIKSLYENGVGVVAGSALAESLYSNRVFKVKSVKDLWYLARATVKFRDQLFEGRKYRFINEVEGMTGAQIALRYVLDNPYVSSALFGTTTMSHLEDNVLALEKEIPQNVFARIQQVK